MSIKVFVNLPVRDLDASIAFFKGLGFSFNPQFTDATATCMIISEENYAMLLTHEKFASFAHLPISDAKAATEVMVALGLDSREAVDRMVEAAVAGGGSEPRPPQDHGFMYGRSFCDLDGHVWEPFWMDPSFVQPQS